MDRIQTVFANRLFQFIIPLNPRRIAVSVPGRMTNHERAQSAARESIIETIDSLAKKRAEHENGIADLDAQIAIQRKLLRFLDGEVGSNHKQIVADLTPLRFTIVEGIDHVLSAATDPISSAGVFEQLGELWKAGKLAREPQEETVRSLISRHRDRFSWEQVNKGPNSKWRKRTTATAAGGGR